MKQGLVALIVGTLFGLGLTVSGMTQPQKVISFLNVFGHGGQWDPTLAFVMIGAISVHFFAYRVKKHKTSPFFGDKYYLPDRKDIDKKLIVGAVIFGVGWGLGGYCPGPAITSLVSLKLEPFLFVTAMTMGMLIQEYVFKQK